MNEFIIFEISNLLHGDVFYLLCTSKIKEVIALESSPGFFGPRCSFMMSLSFRMFSVAVCTKLVRI